MKKIMFCKIFVNTFLLIVRELSPKDFMRTYLLQLINNLFTLFIIVTYFLLTDSNFNFCFMVH